MIGAVTSIRRRRSLMYGTAAAASSRSTVMRTISDPARANAATCWAVDSTSAVSVLVIDWTTIGAPPPTVTLPTWTGTVLWRSSGAAISGETATFITNSSAAGRSTHKPGAGPQQHKGGAWMARRVG